MVKIPFKNSWIRIVIRITGHSLIALLQRVHQNSLTTFWHADRQIDKGKNITSLENVAVVKQNTKEKLILVDCSLNIAYSA